MMTFLNTSVLFLVSLFSWANAATALSSGDVSIIGYRADTTDNLTFVTWVDLDDTTIINFWDYGYEGGGDGSGEGAGGGTWRATGEQNIEWTSGTAISAGTVISISETMVNIGSITGGSASGLNGINGTNGDQLFAGIGTPSGAGATYTGTLLGGIDFQGSAGWETSGTIDSVKSYEPTAIGANQVTLAHIDNAQYTDTRTGQTVAQFKALVQDSSNWTGNNNGGSFSVNTTSFTIVPEPSSSLLVFISILGLSFRYRGKTRECKASYNL